MRICSLLVLAGACGCSASNARSLEHKNHARAHYAKGEYDEAIYELGEAIKLAPRDATAYAGRGDVWYRKEQYGKAIADYDEALKLDPNDALTYNNRGLAWSQSGNLDRALADYNEAIRNDPKHAPLYLNRGTVWRQKRDYDRSIQDYSRCIELAPKDARGYGLRGYVWRDKKEYAKAIADFNEAVRLDPKYFRAYEARSRIWAACPNAKSRDGERALASAMRACELSEWKYADYVETLAAAYAEVGDFASAIKYQKQAIAKAPAEMQPQFRSQLEAYEAGKPWRDE